MIVVLLVTMVCCLKKKKSKYSKLFTYTIHLNEGTPNDFGYERAVNTTDGLSNDCPSRPIGGNSSCTPEQSTAL